MNHEPDQEAPLPALISQLYLSAESMRIVNIAKDEKAPIHGLPDMIDADPLFAARLLRVINFAPGLSRRIATMPQAANALGLENLKCLALGLTAFDLPPAPGAQGSEFGDDGAFQLRDLWEHCLGCATIAGRLALRVPRSIPLLVFTAGFLHDIGKVYLFRGAQQQFVNAISVACDKLIPSTECETMALGMDHVAVGTEWGRQSELTRALELVLRFHHERFATLPPDVDADSRLLIAIVQVADALSEAEGIGKGGDLGEASQEAWTLLKLQDNGWRDQLRVVKDAVRSMREAFGFSKDDVKPPVSRPSGAGAPITAPAALPPPAESSASQTALPIAPRAAKPNEQIKPALGNLSILIVEDHHSLRDLLTLYFRRHGYRVRSASDGATALEILSKETIHVILLDLMLPEIDGFEVLRQIHRSPQDKTPYIIVVSAGALEKDREKVLNLGANEYMAKPFHLMRMLERVQSVERFLL